MVAEFEPDFFIVSLTNGQPKTQKDYNYLKHYDFPTKNRGSKITQNDLKQYILRHRGEPSQKKYACFNVLIYISEMFDVESALTIGEAVANDKPLDPNFLEILESL